MASSGCKNCYAKANNVQFFFKQWGSHKPKDAGMYKFEEIKEILERIAL